MQKENYAYSIREEIWNSSTHGLGIILGFVAIALLVSLSAFYRDAWSIVACSIYGATIIFLYTASTLYHAIPNQKAKPILKKLDHIAIYYLIAGSYTPFLLVPLRNGSGWIMFGIVWGLALLGTFLKIFLNSSGTKLWSILLYLAMGWLSVVMIKDLVQQMNTTALVFMVLGGLFYTFGVFFYVKKSKRYAHAIWHGFVFMGTFMHFFAILFSCAI